MRELSRTRPELATIIYAARFNRESARAAGAFGAASTPDALFELVESAVRRPFARGAGNDEPDGAINALCVLPDGRIAWNWGSSGAIGLWDMKPGTRGLRKHVGSAVKALCGLPDGRLASGSDDGTIRLWDLARTDTEPARLQGHSGSILALCILPDGRLASGSDDRTIRLWDMKNSTETGRLEGHQGPVVGLSVLPDGQLASASHDRTIGVWDLSTGRLSARLAGHTREVTTLCVLPEGRLASASDDATIRIWNWRDGSFGQLEGHVGPVTALCVLPDGRFASGSWDHTIRLWARSAGIATFDVDGLVTSLAVLPDGRLVAGDVAGNLNWIEIPAAGDQVSRLSDGAELSGGDHYPDHSNTGLFSAAQRDRIKKVLLAAGVGAGIAYPGIDQLLRGGVDNARQLALEAIAAAGNSRASFALHLRIIEAFADSVVAQVILRRGDQTRR